MKVYSSKGVIIDLQSLKDFDYTYSVWKKKANTLPLLDVHSSSQRLKRFSCQTKMMLTLFKYFLFCVCVYVRNTLIGQYTDHNDEWDEYGYETILGQLKKKNWEPTVLNWKHWRVYLCNFFCFIFWVFFFKNLLKENFLPPKTTDVLLVPI